MPTRDALSPAVPPTLDLGTIVLRPLRPEDAVELFRYLSDPAVTALTSFPEVSMTLAETMIERARSRWAAGEPSRWGIATADGDRLIGTCGFNDASSVHRWAEIAFDLAREHWSRGIVPAAAAAALAWAFREGGIDRVQAFVRTDNLRSERLLQRLGFMREGCLRDYRICRGTPHDFHLYAILRRDWEASR
jgi:ribosomal-protein-alanine N-acetyltransferase